MANRMAEDARDDWGWPMILHYIAAAFFAWCILVALFPQHTVLVTAGVVLWISGLWQKIDWTLVYF